MQCEIFHQLERPNMNQETSMPLNKKKKERETEFERRRAASWHCRVPVAARLVDCVVLSPHGSCTVDAWSG